MRDAAQLDLVVVGDEQAEDRRRHERLAEGPTGVAAHGDVVQVWCIGRQPAGAGDRLVERGTNAIAGPDCREQTFAIRRAQLLYLAVLEEMLDDRMLAPQLLELSGVGRITGLGLLLPRQAEPVEENFAKLLGGVDIEVEPGVFDDE